MRADGLERDLDSLPANLPLAAASAVAGRGDGTGLELLVLDEPHFRGGPGRARHPGRHWSSCRAATVTIFISTHFMNEAERDRMSTMHAGRVLDSVMPARPGRDAGARDLRSLHRLPAGGGRRASGRRPRPGRSAARPRRAWPPPLQPAPAADLQLARRGAGAAPRPRCGATLALAGSIILDVRRGLRHQPGRGRPQLRRARPRPDHGQARARRSTCSASLLHRARPYRRLRRPGPPHAQRRAVAGHRDTARLRARRQARQEPWRSAPGSTAPCRSAPRR